MLAATPGAHGNIKVSAHEHFSEQRAPPFINNQLRVRVLCIELYHRQRQRVCASVCSNTDVYLSRIAPGDLVDPMRSLPLDVEDSPGSVYVDLAHWRRRPVVSFPKKEPVEPKDFYFSTPKRDEELETVVVLITPKELYDKKGIIEDGTSEMYDPLMLLVKDYLSELMEAVFEPFDTEMSESELEDMLKQKGFIHNARLNW